MLQQPDTAIILAATDGTRMRPLTKYLPKVLVPLKGIPVIIHQIDAICEMGIKRIIILLEPRLGKMIECAVRQYEGIIEFVFVYQEKRNGTASALSLCHDKIVPLEGSFIVLLGDEWNPSFKSITQYVGTPVDGAILVREVTAVEEIIKTASLDFSDNLLIAFDEKPLSHEYPNLLCEAGAFLFSHQFISAINDVCDIRETLEFANGELGIGAAIRLAIQRGYKISPVIVSGQGHVHLTSLADINIAL